MDEMKLFNNSQFGTLEVVLINGKEYFPATDCAKMLGYSNPYDAIEKHCRKDALAFHEVIDSMGRIQKKKYITEGNLWRLITHSKLPSAEKFERWIFDEVIPSIRTTGGYSLGTQTYTNSDIAQIVQQATTAAMKSVIEILPVIVSETVKQIVPLLSAPSQQPQEFDTEEVVIRKYKRRKPAGKIEKLPAGIRQDVNEMLYGVATFREIQDFLKRNGYGDIGLSAINRYKNNLFSGKLR